MKIVREEIFGPVVVLTKFETEEEVVASANDSIYGLANAVFSENITRAHRVAAELKSGTVWINCYNELHPQIPFGGYKQSGKLRLSSFIPSRNLCPRRMSQLSRESALHT